MLNKKNRSVVNRWNNNLQPWLLHHYSGTLNLRVEVLLANYLVQIATDVSFIDWPKVVSRPEFVGHTKNSLAHIFGCLRKHASEKFNLVNSEVTFQQVADYSELVYGEGAQGHRAIGTSATKLVRQKDVIAFFERNLKELGIVGFL